MVKVEIDIPQQIHDFLKGLVDFAGLDVGKYVSEMAVSNIMTDIGTFDGVPFLSKDMIKAKYDLEGIKDYFKAERTQRLDRVEKISERLQQTAEARGITVKELVARIVDDYVPREFLNGEA